MLRFHGEHTHTHTSVFGAAETYELLTQPFYLHCDKLSQSGFATGSENHQEMTNRWERREEEPGGQIEQVLSLSCNPIQLLYIISLLNRTEVNNRFILFTSVPFMLSFPFSHAQLSLYSFFSSCFMLNLFSSSNSSLLFIFSVHTLLYLFSAHLQSLLPLLLLPSISILFLFLFFSPYVTLSVCVRVCVGVCVFVCSCTWYISSTNIQYLFREQSKDILAKCTRMCVCVVCVCVCVWKREGFSFFLFCLFKLEQVTSYMRKVKFDLKLSSSVCLSLSLCHTHTQAHAHTLAVTQRPLVMFPRPCSQSGLTGGLCLSSL